MSNLPGVMLRAQRVDDIAGVASTHPPVLDLISTRRGKLDYLKTRHRRLRSRRTGRQVSRLTVPCCRYRGGR
jgi:hypothetical protein